MQNLKLIGYKIKEIRKKKKISQEKLAEMISMNHRSIIRLENVHNTPTLETLEKIAQALNVNITDFFEVDSIDSREELIKEINSIIEKLNDNELKTFYKTIYHFYN